MINAVGKSIAKSGPVAHSVNSPGTQRNTVARNAFYLFLGQIASTLLAIILNAALGRNLGPADFGMYFFLISMSSFAYVLVDWGQSIVLIREAARQPELIGSLIGSVLAFRLLATGAVVAFAISYTHLFGYEARVQLLTALAMVSALPLVLSQPYGYIFRAQNRMDLDVLISLCAKILTVVVTLAALARGGGLTWVFLAQFVGGSGALGLAIMLGRRVALQAPRPSLGGIRALWKQGTPLAFFFVVVAVQPYIDAVVLSKLTSAAVVGYYGAARNIVGVLITVAAILGSAAFPEMSRAAHHPQEFNRIVRMALRPMLFLGALAAIGCFLFAKFAVDLIYGPSHFDPSVAVVEFYAPVLFILFFNMLLGTVVVAVGRTREMAVAKVGNTVVSTILAIFLVPAFQTHWGNGGIGIVAAIGVGELIMIVIFVWAIPSGTLDRRTLLDVAGALFAGIGTLALFQALPPLTPWLGIPLCVTVFGLLALAAGLVSPAELIGLSKLLKRE